MSSQHRAPLAVFAAVTAACLLTVYLALTANLPQAVRQTFRPLAHAPTELFRLAVPPAHFVRDAPNPPASTRTVTATVSPQRVAKDTSTSDQGTTATVVHTTAHLTPARNPGHRKDVTKHGDHRHHGKPPHATTHGKGKGHAHGPGHDSGKGHDHGKGKGHGNGNQDPIDQAASAVNNVVSGTLEGVTSVLAGGPGGPGGPGNSGNAPGHNKGPQPGNPGGPPGHSKGAQPAARVSVQTVVQAPMAAVKVEQDHSVESHGHSSWSHGDSDEAHGDAYGHAPWSHEEHGHSWSHDEHGHSPRSHEEHGPPSWSHGHEHHVSPGRGRGRH